MSNSIFAKLHKKMTITYSFIFVAIVTVIVFVAYTLTWWSLLGIEKNELVDNIIHEGEEWISSKEAPVNAKELNSGSMLAYFEAPDGKGVIINQLGETGGGKALAANKKAWPSVSEQTKLLRIQDNQGNSYRYLAGVVVVKDGDITVGTLYMFKNFHVFYAAAKHTLIWLVILIIILFAVGSLVSYYLAGKNIKPISEMYEKQKQFTADASHEMRTPLAVLKLACQGVESDDENRLSDFSQETIQMMEEEIDRLTRLTENLMVLARNDSSQLHLNFTSFNLSQLVSRIVQQMKLVADEKHIELIENIQSDIELTGDANGINRLFIILLDNALKYSPSETEVSIEMCRNDNAALLKIKDQGEGICDEDKKKIFDRFYRVDKARSRSLGGLGLGLSLAKSIVLEHNGNIWVEDNKLGKGSVFCISLPLKNRN